ncbi:MAG: glycoside hydrolase family 88 protein [Terracidiphilus sp.]|nr:glycoside hydrolase family 88 protein [Terracidiphilus sp.]
MKLSWFRNFAVTAAVVGAAFALSAQTATSAQPWSVRAANAAMERWPQGHIGQKPAFKYELGTYLQGVDDVYLNTADARYYNYIKSSIDELITDDGSIPTYRPDEWQLDAVLTGRQLLRLYGMTGQKKYLTAATTLYEQLEKQPRTASGGFWHKKIYPNQMWLDGLYMAEPFYAQYATISHKPEKYADIEKQFVLVYEHMRDAKTGLLYHGWDESKQQRWANKDTGLSPEIWARSMGWYMMALVDTLDYLPADSDAHKKLVEILKSESAAIVKVQDAKSGVWLEVMNKGAEKGNYLESSASSMFVYTLAKGVRKGYLPQSYLPAVEKGWKGLLDNFVEVGPNDDVKITKTVSVGGLGGSPVYRDGTYAYYLSEKVVTNDPKGVGPFIMAATEVENIGNAKLARGRKVVMDGWFNSQKMKDAFGEKFLFHYKWSYEDQAGYSMVGRILENFGAQTAVLATEPTAATLKDAQVFMIVSPDNAAKNPTPNYANATDADELAKWVKAGGVLVLLSNDAANTDLKSFNLIADKFGMHFTDLLRKHVIGTQWEMGKVVVDGKGPVLHPTDKDPSAGAPVFHHPHTLYIKDVCTIVPAKGVETLLKEGDDIFMARAKFGKGAVIAFVDPWFYNEYADGRRLPASYDNYAGGQEFLRYVLEQVGK